MSKVIVYKKINGAVSVITPTPEYLEIFGIEAIALKDVPFGSPFKIVDRAEVPVGEDALSAWDVWGASDGVGADYDAGSMNHIVGYTEDLEPVIERRPEAE